MFIIPCLGVFVLQCNIYCYMFHLIFYWLTRNTDQWRQKIMSEWQQSLIPEAPCLSCSAFLSALLLRVKRNHRAGTVISSSPTTSPSLHESRTKCVGGDESEMNSSSPLVVKCHRVQLVSSDSAGSSHLLIEIQWGVKEPFKKSQSTGMSCRHRRALRNLILTSFALVMDLSWPIMARDWVSEA